MNSFIDIERTFAGQPARLGVVLQRVDVGRGREELFRDQLPELLRSLAEHARIASIRASNAIEGVDVDEGRAASLAGGAVTATATSASSLVTETPSTVIAPTANRSRCR